MLNTSQIIRYIRTTNINLTKFQVFKEERRASKVLPQVLIDALVDLHENKNYVEHQKYLFLIKLISKTNKKKQIKNFLFFRITCKFS